MRSFKLTKYQWQVLSSAIIHIAEAVLIFSLAAFFAPVSLSLASDYPRINSLGYLISGLTLLTIGIILSKRGK